MKKSLKVTRSKRMNKSSEGTESLICPVCEEVIRDATEKEEGQASVFCVGACSTWLHRQCTGLSTQAFKLLDSSAEPFMCPNCKLNSQQLEIEDLKSKIAALMSLVEERLPHAADSSTSSSVSSVLPPLSYAAALKSSTCDKGVSQSPRDRSERKINVVMYGIDECLEGMKKPQCVCQDHESVVDVIKTLDSTLDKQSVRDSFRLGRYVKEKRRPILVKLACASNASSVLSNHKKLFESEKYS